MESTSHAIFDCPTSQAVWRMTRFWKVIENKKTLPFADLLRSTKSKFPMEDFAMVCWLSWRLWGERNKVVHVGENGDPRIIFELSITSYGEWKALHCDPAQPQVVGSDVWLPPQSGFFKLNVDTSVISGSDYISICAVIRDEKGLVSGALAKTVDIPFSPFLAECIALREGLIFAKDLSLGHLVVETDAINVVLTVGENHGLFVESPILKDVKQLLAQLHSASVNHICRSANHVVHILTRLGFNAKCTNVWLGETPSIVSNAISVDGID